MVSRLRQTMNGIQFRVSMLICGIAILIVTVQLIGDSLIEVTKTRREQALIAQTETAALAVRLSAANVTLDDDGLAEVVTKLAPRGNVSGFLVLDGQGRSIASLGTRHPNPPEMIKKLETGSQSAIFIDSEHILAKGTIWSRTGQSGKVVGIFDRPSILEVAGPIVKANLSASLPIILLGTILASFFARQITLPLNRLASSASEVAKGNIDLEVPIEGPDEVRKLGRATSVMIGTLRENIHKIYELAYVDRTTRLPNREYFRNELTRAIKRNTRQGTTGALLFVDLDGFKRVNDTHGHDIGDMLLGEFSDRLANVLRAEDLIGFESISRGTQEQSNEKQAEGLQDAKKRQVLARLGGDEFTVLLSDIREATDAAIVSRRIIKAVSEPFEINGLHLNIGASIGIAAFPQDGSNYQTILKNADMAMYKAKEEGKNTFRFYSSELNQAAIRKSEIETDLRNALEAGDQLEIYYQPKIDCATGSPKSAEALLRWKHPSKGMIEPEEFICVAEETGLILPLGRWVLEQACEQIVDFQALGMGLSVSVNISPAQFEQEELADTVADVLGSTGAPAGRLELEVTEGMAMQDTDKALKNIQMLKKLGVKLTIDDFGTGFSNLSQLSRLPFDSLKIDRSFIEMLSESDGKSGVPMVGTILVMAQSMNYETVAVGVETAAQHEFLVKHGCTSVQGFLFARAMSKTDFHDWYVAWHSRKGNLELVPKRRA